MKEILHLLQITKSLKEQYGRNFTLDGRLIGDIGEVLAAEKYGLELLSENNQVHDAKEKSTDRLIQIKSSMKGNFYFPVKQVPEFILYLLIKENGDLEEIYNGPGKFLSEEYIQKRNLKAFNNTYYTLSKGMLLKLNKEIKNEDKIKIVHC
ncbi:DUF6998 domain-containing protein [Belliella pelovolcani]|uniref:DUF6998 domain-containing protein n=1 Tax=Belliella pelovolcani TaxID=529505 RepID=A0A1N7PMP4_9BACT|nr:hypothetical protein [Belliella pelovolcani]SIT11717.1 hypothetical protein SAMN05421761_1185 [Belliella pelovolcani]